MMKTNKLRRLWALGAMAGMVLLLAGYLEAKKGDKFEKEGKEAAARQDWDSALALYEKALATEPSNALYLLDVRRARFQAAEKHVGNGQKLRENGELEPALAEFQKALL